MKKGIKFILAASLTLLYITNVQAAKSFEGVITYDIKIDNSAGTIPQEQMAMFDGSQMVISMRQDEAKVQMNMGPFQMTTINNKNTNLMIQLHNMMGQKIEIKSKLDSLEKAAKASGDKPTYKYDSDTKTIAGYLCKKAEITLTDKATGKKMTTIVYYTDDIPVTDYNTNMEGIKGYPLQFEVNQNGITMTMTAKTIEKKKMTDDDFAVPAGYTEMTMEQFKAAMQQMQQGGGQ